MENRRPILAPKPAKGHVADWLRHSTFRCGGQAAAACKLGAGNNPITSTHGTVQLLQRGCRCKQETAGKSVELSPKYQVCYLTAGVDTSEAKHVLRLRGVTWFT